MMCWVRRCTALLALVPCMLVAEEKESLPKWELGVAFGGQALRDYRGSKEEQVQAFPVPLVIYRGDFLKADRNGVRGEFLANDRVELNLSGEASLNGQSEDNTLREGMPELDSAFELGPSFNISLAGNGFRSGWQLRFPLRGVISVGDEGVRARGYNFNPRLTYIEPNFLGAWRAKVNFGLLYGSETYHDYYYSVDEQYANAERPAYDADAGFSGYTIKTSLSQRHNNFWYGASVRYDNLSGASFEDSPLVETRDYWAVSFAIAWVGWRSGQ